MSKTFNGKSAFNYLFEDMGVHTDEVEGLMKTAGLEASEPDALDQLAEAIQRMDESGKDWRTGKAKVNIPSVPYDLDQFHNFNKKGEAISVYDMKIFEDICSREHIFILGGTPYFYRAGVYLPDLSGTHLKTEIRKRIYPELIRSNTIKRVYDLFLGAEELEKDSNELNNYPKTWVNFKNGMYDAEQDEWHDHSPEYLSINQIPHEYIKNAPNKGIIDNWLKKTLPAADDREMLLEYLGYCLTKDTELQKFLILKGLGGTGKSTLINLFNSIVGDNNVSAISLLQLTQRFSAYGIVGKLLNSCADLEIGALEDVSTLKKILGEDKIRVEQKGKDAFTVRSYAKMIFSTNEFPLVKSEKTNGFFRRVIAVEMNLMPKQADPRLFDKLSEDIPHLIDLAMQALHRMYQRIVNHQGSICESKHSQELVQQLRRDSDTVEAWIDEVGEPFFSFTPRSELPDKYTEYCREEERTPLTKKNLYSSLRLKGFLDRKVHGVWYLLPMLRNGGN